jgi:hypothetical protein
MQPTGLSTYSAFGMCLALTLACVTERPTPHSANSTSVTIAGTSTDSTSAIVDSSRVESEIDSLAVHAPIPVGYPAAKEPQCPDSVDVFECYALQVEKPILATTGIRVRRIGDTLRVNTNTRTLKWIDTEMIGEGAARHFYEGTITVPSGGKKYAVVRHNRYEDIPYVLIDWISGDTLSVPDRPVLSPDSNRIVAGAFSEDGKLELEVWNIASAPPTREFAHEWDGVGPVNIAWRDNRTIDFRLRQTSGGRESVPTPIPMVLTHEDSTWRLATRR